MRATKDAPARVFTGARLTDESQRLAQQTARRVAGLPFANGVFVKGVVFAAATARIVQHNLGRPFSGYVVTRNYGTNVSNVPGEASTAASDTNNQINMICTVAATFDLYVY